MADIDTIASDLYDEGRAAFERGDFARAVELLEGSTWVRPHFKTLEILGRALKELGLVERASVYLAASAGLSPKQIPSRLALAEIFASRGEAWDARIQLEEALRVNPQSRRAAELMATLPPEDE